MSASPAAPAATSFVKERFIAGDPLRGLACLTVIFWHVAVGSASTLPPAGVSFELRGELGTLLGPPITHLAVCVWFFFALSGYLIARPFVLPIITGDARRPRLGPYARNRALRILPAFWVVLTLTVLVWGTEGNSLRQMLAFYGFGHLYDSGPFTTRMVHAWTLNVEMVFYALLPLLALPAARLLHGRGTPVLRAGLILGALAAVAAVSVGIGRGAVGPSASSVPGSAWAFVPGIALATIEPLVRPHLHGRRFGPPLALGLAVFVVVAFLADVYVITGSRAGDVIAAATCAGILASPMALQWSTGGAHRLLDNRLLHWFGERAYSIYLVHLLVLQLLRPLVESLGSTKLSLLVVFPLGLVGATLFGAVVFRFVEQPFLRRRVPWRTERPAPEPEPAAAAVAPEVAAGSQRV